MPGSPATVRHADVLAASASSASSSCASSGSRPTVAALCSLGTCLHPTPSAFGGPVQGDSPMIRARPPMQDGCMPLFLLHHRHVPAECAAAFAAWTGFESPLRHESAASTCLTRWARTLVACAGGRRCCGAGAAPALSRPSHRPDRDPRGRDPLIRLAALHCGRVARARIGCSRARPEAAVRPPLGRRRRRFGRPLQVGSLDRRGRAARAPTGATSGSSTGTAARSSARRRTAPSRTCPASRSWSRSRCRRRRSRRPSTPRSP